MGGAAENYDKVASMSVRAWTPLRGILQPDLKQHDKTGLRQMHLKRRRNECKVRPPSHDQEMRVAAPTIQSHGRKRLQISLRRKRHCVHDELAYYRLGGLGVIAIIIIIAHCSQNPSAHYDSCLSRACSFHIPPPTED